MGFKEYARSGRRPFFPTAALLLRAAIGIFLGLSFPASAEARELSPQVRILFISSFGSDSSDTAKVIETLKQELVSHGFRPEIYVEYLDTFRLQQTKESRKLSDDVLAQRYGNIGFNVILAQASDAIKAAARYREKLAIPPPVYCFDWIDAALAECFSGTEGFYGRSLGLPFPPTLRLAARLFPKAKRAFLVASPIDPEYVPGFYRDLEAARGDLAGLELAPLVNAAFDEVERTLSLSGEDAFALLLPGEWWLENGEYLGGRTALDKLNAASSMPYFGIMVDSFGSGLVGGYFADRERMGREAAGMILGILGGDPALVPWGSSDALVPILDHRALERWAIPPSLFPSDALIRYAPPEFWIRYESQLKSAGVTLSVLSLTLLVRGVIRRREQLILRKNNETLEFMVEARTGELTKTNLELKVANESLKKAMKDLEEAKDRSVASEKLAALGRLTASIGHELNTPLAAMSSASRIVTDCLGRDLSEALGAPLKLGAEAGLFIREAMRRMSRENPPLSRAVIKAEGKARDKAEALLKEAGIPDAYAIAQEMAELGIADLAARAIPLLKSAEAPTFIAISRATLGSIRAAAIMEDAVAKASRVVAFLGTYARGGEDETSLPLHLASELRNILGLLDLRFPREFEVDLDIGEDIHVCARRADVIGVFFNLIKNAIQAIDGSGRIGIRAEERDGAVHISVTDTGPGIPEDVRERIFEPFFSTRPMGEGAGLGLDVSRRLARRNGGDISFRSRPGETVFTVALPAGTGHEAR